MKRQKRKQNPAAAKANGQPSPDGAGRDDGVSRRAMLLKLRNGVIAVAVVGGAGWYLTEEVRAINREHDLSLLGNGIATVVQIHDPQCSKCTALQRETREAMEAFSQDEIQYLVASIRTDEGRAFARKYGVGHVTLLLFDGQGERRETLVGANTARNLERVFQRHVRQSPKS